MKKLILGEAQDILRSISIEELKMFDKIRKAPTLWEPLKAFTKNQKDLKMDQIYRLRRPKTQDEVLRNAIEHEYYAARISSGVIFLQICENAAAEMERRETKDK